MHTDCRQTHTLTGWLMNRNEDGDRPVRCFMCERFEENGIFLAGHWLCHSCEERIVFVDPDDEAEYAEVVHGIRRFWDQLLCEECSL